jgi:fluoroacetyl-CoA thioesterase
LPVVDGTRNLQPVKELIPGIEMAEQVTVTPEMSPPHLDPAVVLSTPKMIELMEWVATRSVQPYLGDSRTSVGTHVNVSHEAAARKGEQVTVSATLVEIDRRRLVFQVLAIVGERIIGRGSHERFIVDRDAFSRA